MNLDYFKVLPAGKNREQHKFSFIADGTIAWYSHWKIIWECLAKLKIDTPYKPAAPLSGIYPREKFVCDD